MKESPATTDPEADLIRDIASFSKDPLKFVQYAFPWGSGPLSEHPGPDMWQTEILAQVRDGLLTVNKAIRIAVASGNGPGKSALTAWLILWALSTFVDTKGVITSNTETQLKTKSWSELAKWYQMFIASRWFKLTATAIYSVDPKHEQTWRVDQVPWSENRSEAFAGMHNKGKRILIVFDEASAIPDKIWEVTEGALTDENTEIIWCVFGNPTRNDGKFHSCFHIHRNRWSIKQIDSRTSRLTNKEEIARWAEDYGEDSDFFRIHVRGEFPNVSDRQFIPNSYVEAARGKALNPTSYSFAPKIISVEPAWTGGDETVIGLRQGNMFRILAKYARNSDDFQIAGYVAKFEDFEKADAVFIDLGYGTGIFSAGQQLKRQWILVPFGAASSDPGFLNKRAEMWNSMKQWLKNGGSIPDEPILCGQIVGPEYYVKATGANAGKVVLEAKEDMKTRGLESPNRADALALTFAFPVIPKNQWQGERVDGVVITKAQGNLEFANSKYNPLDR